MKKLIPILLSLCIIVLLYFLFLIKKERDYLQEITGSEYQTTIHTTLMNTEPTLLYLGPDERVFVGSELYEAAMSMSQYGGVWTSIADKTQMLSEAILFEQYSEELEPIRHEVHTILQTVNNLLSDHPIEWYESISNPDSIVNIEISSLVKQ